MRHGVFTPNFGTFCNPRSLRDLAAIAEAAGWDGWFLWDHIVYRDPLLEVNDPWVALAAMATATERLRLGPLVTPLARRRPWKLAREAVTLDQLSGGRTVLGVGLGSPTTPEFRAFNEEADPRRRGAMLDEALDLLVAIWSGEPVHHTGTHYRVDGVRFLPRPVSRPRIPIWVAVVWPHRRPLARAARWDGVFPLELTPPDLRALLRDVGEHRRGPATPFDVVVVATDQHAPAEWAAAGATWLLHRFEADADPEQVRRALAAGPPKV